MAIAPGRAMFPFDVMASPVEIKEVSTLTMSHASHRRTTGSKLARRNAKIWQKGCRTACHFTFFEVRKVQQPVAGLFEGRAVAATESKSIDMVRRISVCPTIVPVLQTGSHFSHSISYVHLTLNSGWRCDSTKETTFYCCKVFERSFRFFLPLGFSGRTRLFTCNFHWYPDHWNPM